MIDDNELAERLNPDFINIDPLEPTYREALDEISAHIDEELREETALLCIDMQYLDAARGHGVFAEGAISGVDPEAQEYYFTMLEEVVVPNVARLQKAFRDRGLEVIHVRIQSMTQDGRDRGPQHKRLDLHAAPGSKEAEFLPEIAPVGDEIIINKTASGVFSSTNLEYILNNLGIKALVVVGVYTDECVSTTVRNASDLGFDTVLIEDGCTCVTENRHRFTVDTLNGRYVSVLTTEQMLKRLQRYSPVSKNKAAASKNGSNSSAR